MLAKLAQRLLRLIGTRPIEALRELPLTTDPVRRGTLAVYGDLIPAALFTDLNLHDLIRLRIANLSLEHGYSDVEGVRNVWIADGPAFQAHQLTQYRADDGQEISGLTFSPDGSHFVYVRGGDHDANWPAAGDLPPDPDASADQPVVTIWSADVSKKNLFESLAHVLSKFEVASRSVLICTV